MNRWFGSRAHAPGMSVPHQNVVTSLDRLPIRNTTEIYSYEVVAPGYVHIYPPHNEGRRYGWRLSFCPETFMDEKLCTCACYKGVR